MLCCIIIVLFGVIPPRSLSTCISNEHDSVSGGLVFSAVIGGFSSTAGNLATHFIAS